jgi:hypothetical protein
MGLWDPFVVGLLDPVVTHSCLYLGLGTRKALGYSLGLLDPVGKGREARVGLLDPREVGLIVTITYKLPIMFGSRGPILNTMALLLLGPIDPFELSTTPLTWV